MRSSYLRMALRTLQSGVSKKALPTLILVLALVIMGCEKKEEAAAPVETTQKIEETAEDVPAEEGEEQSDETEEGKDDFSPTLKPDGSRWRVAYYEGGPYINYVNTLSAIVLGLRDLGWLSADYEVTVGEEENGAREMWEWLEKVVKSEYLEFNPKHFYSSNWDAEKTKADTAAIMAKLKAGEIDFVIAAGTAAGKALANNDHKVPVMVVSTTNAVESEIVASYEDSGFDHVTARVDPNKWERQLKLFHGIIKFKKLGVAYEDSEDGRTYATLGDVERVSKSNDFEVVPCFTKSDIPDQEEAYQSVLKCHKQLAGQVDAVFLTQQNGLIANRMPELLKPFFDKKIPTISQTGTKHVKRGVLLGISRADYSEVGLYSAEVMAQILRGASPRSINQIFEESPKITMNLATAKKIGFDPPVDILGASDEIYQEIE